MGASRYFTMAEANSDRVGACAKTAWESLRSADMDPDPNARPESTVDQRLRWFVAPEFMQYSRSMRTASVQEVPQQWAEILCWVKAGDEVQVTQDGRVVARIVPVKPVATPDFLGRSKAVWGEMPTGKALSAVVSEARGNGS